MLISEGPSARGHRFVFRQAKCYQARGCEPRSDALMSSPIVARMLRRYAMMEREYSVPLFVLDIGLIKQPIEGIDRWLDRSAGGQEARERP